MKLSFSSGVLMLSFSAGLAQANGLTPPDYDTNGDGQTTAQEIQAARSTEFAQIDTNSDNALTLGELRDWFAAKTIARFAALDTDSNGSISATEFAQDTKHPGGEGFSKRLFKLADTDANDALSSEEFKAAFTGADHAVHMFAHLDSNDDNAISLTEFLAMPTPPAGRRGRNAMRSINPNNPKQN